jgi:hypothetical protein
VPQTDEEAEFSEGGLELPAESVLDTDSDGQVLGFDEYDNTDHKSSPDYVAGAGKYSEEDNNKDVEDDSKPKLPQRHRKMPSKVGFDTT